MNIKECTCFYRGYDFCIHCLNSGVLIEHDEFDKYISGDTAKVIATKKQISIDEKIEIQILLDDTLVSEVNKQISLGISLSEIEVEYCLKRIKSRIIIWKELIKKKKSISNRYNLINHIRHYEDFYNAITIRFNGIKKIKKRKAKKVNNRNEMKKKSSKKKYNNY